MKTENRVQETGLLPTQRLVRITFFTNCGAIEWAAALFPERGFRFSKKVIWGWGTGVIRGSDTIPGKQISRSSWRGELAAARAGSRPLPARGVGRCPRGPTGPGLDPGCRAGPARSGPPRWDLAELWNPLFRNVAVAHHIYSEISCPT